MANKVESYPVHIPANQRPQDQQYFEQLSGFFESASGTTLDKLRTFPKFAPVGEIGRFLAKNEIFKKILNVQGNIVECGVYMGGGLMSWATMSAIYEPLNHLRRVVGFDTFQGFADVDARDKGQAENDRVKKGGVAANSYDELTECARIFDIYRPLGHIPKVELVAGDVRQSMPEYLAKNPHFLVSLLYLDFDLYEPTKAAIETLRPRMPKGSIIAFDELNIPQWPGETVAVLDTLGIRNLRIERFPFQPQISYAVLE